MNILLFVAVAFSLAMLAAILWAIARVFEEQEWSKWIFGFWLAFLCIFTARYFTGF